MAVSGRHRLSEAGGSVQEELLGKLIVYLVDNV